MSGVKQSYRGILLCFCAAAALSGCAKNQLARFAPPGIIKYEDLEGDKPVNPEVAKRVEEHRKEPGSGKFPVLSETPGPQAVPARLSEAQVEEECVELRTRRDVLAANVSEDRDLSGEELERDLAGERDALNENLDKDNVAAARERREKLEPLDTSNQ